MHTFRTAVIILAAVVTIPPFRQIKILQPNSPVEQDTSYCYLPIHIRFTRDFNDIPIIPTSAICYLFELLARKVQLSNKKRPTKSMTLRIKNLHYVGY